ncbi:MAG: tRNA isopentenyl-2-thiomethyl-A-37 hydroxylase MiaE [Planctomycetota bacterium]
MRLLHAATPPAWARHALLSPGTLLLDHLHCEMKAASVALSLVSKNPDVGELVSAMLDLAEEELAHYRQIHAVMRRRGIRPEPITPSAYMRQLRAEVGRARGEPLLDRLIIAALIEARSCERFQILSAATAGDQELSALFRELMIAEARHTTAYADLARRLFGEDALRHRLCPIAAIESAVLARLAPGPRVHSGWLGL